MKSDLAPRLIDDQWTDFAKATIPPDADEIEKANARRCFFSGALAVFGMVTDSVTQKEDALGCVDLLSALSAELEEFVVRWQAEYRAEQH